MILPKDQNGNPIKIVAIDENGNLEPVQVVSPDGRAYVSTNEVTGKPILPKDKNGNFILSVNEAGDQVIAVDSDNTPIIGTDAKGNLIVPKDKDGNELLNVNEDGKIVLEIDPKTGKPIVPLDNTGKLVLP